MNLMKRIICLLLLVAFLSPPRPAVAWSESGHHLIALLAFRRLSPEEQKKLLAILEQHPRWKEDFEPPANVSGDAEVVNWRVGRAGAWPDLVRRSPTYHRPTWHYELGASLVIGEKSLLKIPDEPGPLPSGAALDSQELYLSQAVELCKGILADEKQPAADRALALCWISHLVADAHQPCHAGSLYMEDVFVEIDGDRGGNRVPTKQRGNLHSLWDQLLGDRFSTSGVRRRINEIESDKDIQILLKQATDSAEDLDPRTWLAESRKLAIERIYTPEVLDSLRLVSRGLLEKPEPIDLSETYLKSAGRTAQQRAAQAAARLAEIWRRALN